MDRAAERWATVRALLGEALEFDAAAQPRYLETIEDATLREEVRAYLAWVPAGPDPLDQQPWGAAIIPAGVAEGSRVTNYRLLKELGSGGMGTVYLAERDDREFEQRVAIKVIQRGLRSDEMIRLFRQERQILASLNHPSIARLVDGGVTEDGRPFFVMEYVDGVPIDVYCGLHDLNILERLKLFLLVCSAVQAAHQSLIVHRDLKPANILVTADCIPKLLDFGVAGLFGEQGRSPGTMGGTMGMTPRYTSPEHARGEVSGAATDIYSLGVLLFELLTGSPPLAQGESRTAFLRALQEDAPRRPSDIAAGGAQRRTLRGDLDQIVLHALEKLPAGRYPSVESFAADIRRYLEGFPVLANTASWRYRAGKFIRRHRTLVAAGTALTIVAGLSFAAVLRSARIAERQHALAELRFEQGRELARFYMLEVDRLLERLPGSTPARALITGHTLAYIDRLAPGAVGDVSLQREFATAYERVALTQGMPQFANLGDRPGALGNVQKALRIRRQILTLAQATLDDRIAYGDALMLLGHLTLSGGSPASAIEVYLQGAREFEAVRARSPHPAGRLYNRISGAYLYAAGAYSGGGFTPDTGDLDAALPLYDKAVRLMPLERKAREGQAPALRLYLDSNEALMEESWAIALANVLRYGEADRHFEAALRLIHAPGIDSANAEILRKEGSIAIYYANALVDRGELARARPLLAVSERIFSGLMKSDPENIISKADVVYLSALQGRVEIAGGQVAAGLALLEQAIGQEEEVRARGRGFEESGGFLSRHWMWSAEGWMAAKQAGRARVRYGQVLELAGAIMRQHPDDVNTRLNVAAAELGMGRALAAEWDAAGAVRHRGLAAEAASAVLAAHPEHLRAQAMLAEAKGL